MQSVKKISLKPKQIKNIQDLMEISTMWETAVKKHEEALINKGINKGIEQGIERGILIVKKNTLIDQFTIKFGKSITAEKKIRAVNDLSKLEKALRKILFAKSGDEVLKCLLK